MSRPFPWPNPKAEVWWSNISPERRELAERIARAWPIRAFHVAELLELVEWDEIRCRRALEEGLTADLIRHMVLCAPPGVQPTLFGRPVYVDGVNVRPSDAMADRVARMVHDIQKSEVVPYEPIQFVPPKRRWREE